MYHFNENVSSEIKSWLELKDVQTLSEAAKAADVHVTNHPKSGYQGYNYHQGNGQGRWNYNHKFVNKYNTQKSTINVNQSNNSKDESQNSNGINAYKNSHFSYQPRSKSPMRCFKCNKICNRKSECRSKSFVPRDHRNPTERSEEPHVAFIATGRFADWTGGPYCL